VAAEDKKSNAGYLRPYAFAHHDVFNEARESPEEARKAITGPQSIDRELAAPSSGAAPATASLVCRRAIDTAATLSSTVGVGRAGVTIACWITAPFWPPLRKRPAGDTRTS
jgi:hypothetical protein